MYWDGGARHAVDWRFLAIDLGAFLLNFAAIFTLGLLAIVRARQRVALTRDPRV